MGIFTFSVSLCVYVSYNSWNKYKLENRDLEKSKQSEMPQKQSGNAAFEQKNDFQCNDKFTALEIKCSRRKQLQLSYIIKLEKKTQQSDSLKAFCNIYNIKFLLDIL